MDMTSYLLGRKSSGGGGNTPAFDYIIDARSVIGLSDDDNFKITDENLISQLQQILTDGIYQADGNIKPLRIGLYAKKHGYTYDFAFLTSSMISDETEDTYDRPPHGDYLSYNIEFVYTVGNVLKRVILTANTNSGISNVEWYCAIVHVG